MGVLTFASSKLSRHRDQSDIITFIKVGTQWSQSSKITRKSLAKMLSS
jgi:hypothetical protein